MMVRGLVGGASLLMVSLALLVSTSAKAEIKDYLKDYVPDRREEPTKTAEGFLAFPVYTHVPGIGTTVGFGLLETNLFGSSAQAIATALTGDSNAVVMGLREVHLIKDSLVMHFFAYSTRIPFQVFDRGFSGGPDDYFYLVNKEYGGSAEIDYQLWERRIQFNAKFGASRLRSVSVANSDGYGYVNADAAESDSFAATLYFILDLTDDFIDPRKGFNFQVVRDSTDIFDGLRSRFYTMNYLATAYVPLPHDSAWVFNVFRSDAIVYNANTMSASDLGSRLGLGCSGIGDPAAQASCLSTQNQRVQERLGENQQGTANSLGGATNMRAFPSGRFRGAHNLLYATELRWNLTTEERKFDFGFMKGSRSLLQIAPFYEAGATCDSPHTVENEPLHSSYGIGVRFGFSGTLIRADFAVSDEGPQYTVYVGYPLNFPDY